MVIRSVFNRKNISAGIFALCLCAEIFAATPVVKVDLNMSGRQDDEVNEPGWTSWPVPECSTAVANTYEGVTFTFNRSGSVGASIKADWYKAGIQTPYYARLVCDGLTVVNGSSGGAIELAISGLAAGTHSLLVYLNTVDGKEYGPIDISVNGTKVLSNIALTNRALTTESAAKAFFTFTVSSGATTKIIFSPSTSSSATYKNVVINAFGLNVPNADLQATTPFPADRDLHVDADAGNVTMSWTAASGASSHGVYFGTDSETVASATTSSSIYKGKQSGVSYLVTGLTNHEIYWWRVDEIDASGTVTQGQIWSFSPRHLAFPGAEGYGRFARGGRGGKVVHVTNLNDAGAGSLREAVENDIGPRTIVFDVSGIIKLASRLTLSSSFVTIAGQTAPGKGICVRAAPFGFSGVSDGIMRFMRIRLGAGETFDGTGLQGSDYSIFDHNSVSWTIDESFSSRSGKHITLQRTMLAEALNIAGHVNYAAGTMHGYAATISGDTGSFHHNLLAHNDGRNWSLGGGLDANGYYAGCLDIFNNVVYNWNDRTTDGGAHMVNFVANYYKPGPATSESMKYALSAQWDGFPGTQQYYCRGNLVKGYYDDTSATRNGCTSESGNPSPWVSSPFFPSYATIQTAVNAYKDVLSDVGAIMPVFDDHDIRMVRETWNGSYTYKGSESGLEGLIDNESDAGGYESYPSQSREAGFDTDNDGLPDWWEKLINTSTSSSSGDFTDANADLDKDGYTNLEDYLNWLATPSVTVDMGKTVQVNLAQYSRGYMSSPSWKAATSDYATLTVKDSMLTITPKSTCGVKYLSFTVTDGEGASKTRSLGLYVPVSTGVVKRLVTAKQFSWTFGNKAIGLKTQEPGVLVLHDLAGRQVRSYQVKKTIVIQRSTLPSGILIGSFDSDEIHQTQMFNVVK